MISNGPNPSTLPAAAKSIRYQQVIKVRADLGFRPIAGPQLLRRRLGHHALWRRLFQTIRLTTSTVMIGYVRRVGGASILYWLWAQFRARFCGIAILPEMVATNERLAILCMMFQGQWQAKVLCNVPYPAQKALTAWNAAMESQQ